MKGALNIYRDNFLEKEELDRLMSFIKDNPALFIFINSTQSFGIIQQGASTTVDPAFKVEVGTNSNSLKIITDSYALDSNGNLICLKAFDNLPIPTTDSTWYWMKISHRYDNYEPGFVDIAVDGTLSGVNTKFLEVLRGGSSGFPVKLKFFTQGVDGTLTPATNSGIYEVVSVAGDTTAIIAGNLSSESNLRYVVLGAFSIKTSVASITSTGIYSYDSCQIDFVTETVTDTAPTTGFTTGEDFYIARVNSDGATVTVQDKRSIANSYFRINFGDIVISGKADINASNLSAPDITSWLTKLVLYTSTQVDTALASYMLKSQNLNDVTSKATARTNLDVYDKAYIDKFGTILTRKVVNIGDWNMYVSGGGTGITTKSVLHGLTATNIRNVSVMIRDDNDVEYYQGLGVVTPLNIDPAGINLVCGAAFDSAYFNQEGGFNRGWVVIDSIPV
jgi:hypothetical protein